MRKINRYSERLQDTTEGELLMSGCRNGSRELLKIICSFGREGSNPSPDTV